MPDGTAGFDSTVSAGGWARDGRLDPERSAARRDCCAATPLVGRAFGTDPVRRDPARPADDDAAGADPPTSDPAGEVTTGATGVPEGDDPVDGGDGVGTNSEGEDAGDSIVVDA